jgi:hypothetical protein
MGERVWVVGTEVACKPSGAVVEVVTVVARKPGASGVPLYPRQAPTTASVNPALSGGKFLRLFRLTPFPSLLSSFFSSIPPVAFPDLCPSMEHSSHVEANLGLYVLERGMGNPHPSSSCCVLQDGPGTPGRPKAVNRWKRSID